MGGYCTAEPGQLVYTSRRPVSTSGRRDQPLVGERSGAAGPSSLTSRSCTTTLDPKNSKPRRSSLKECPLDGLAEGGSLVLIIALSEAVLDGVPAPVSRYSNSLPLARVWIRGNVLVVLGGRTYVLEFGMGLVVPPGARTGVGRGGGNVSCPIVDVRLVSQPLSGPGMNPLFWSIGM